MGAEASKQCGGNRSKDSDPAEKTRFINRGQEQKSGGPIEDGDYEPMSLAVGKANTGYFGVAALITQMVLTTFFFFTTYDLTEPSVFDSTESYNFWVGAGMWIFVGMGYIMTFLQHYGIGALGSTLFIGALGLQWSLLLYAWMTNGTIHVEFNILSFIQANFGVATVMVSFGAVMGKTTPVQLLMLVMFEMTAAVANKVLIMNNLDVRDIGGTFSVHIFGAFFGLAASWCMTPATINEEKYHSTYTSDLLSMLGTFFMWLFWPCFVAGGITVGTAQQKMALLNTAFSLLGSTVTVFAITPLISKQRLTTLPIQMATLAGGVAIGAIANFPVVPGGVILIGMGAGMISCCMFVFAHNVLPDKYDSCGVMSLNGVPGIYGAIISIFLPLFCKSAEINAGNQALGLLCVLMAAIISGCTTGFLLKKSGPPAVAYNDEAYWDTAA